MLLPWLAGCPYVFGPADFSNVPKRPAEGDTGDTGPALVTTTPAPTGDTGPLVAGPAITQVEALPVFQGLLLAIEVDTADGLEGGALLVRGGDAPVELPIPGDAVAVNGSRLVATLALPDPCEGIAVELDLSIRAADGAEGPAARLALEIEGLGFQSDYAGVVDLGELAPPVLWCGGIEQLGEYDRYDFTVAQDLTAEIVTTWDSAADLDLVLKQPPQTLDSSTTIVQPAFLSGDLAAGTPYQLVVQHFSGPPPGVWLLAFLPGS